MAILRVEPVAADFIVTSTPATAGPLGSVTVPRMLPVAVCANRGIRVAVSQEANITSRTIRQALSRTRTLERFMGPPPTETTDAINTSECNLTGEAGTAGLVHRGKKD